MKRQYLGDAKDAFKWDYLDFLTRELGMQLLNILLMLTPDKGNGDGRLNPEMFCNSQNLLQFCKELQKRRKGSDSDIMQLLRDLPKWIGARYAVNLHNAEKNFAALHAAHARRDYFDGIPSDRPQVIFLDPDTGFEPQTATDAHIKHKEVQRVLEYSHSDSVVVVYQDLIRKSPETFAEKIQRQFPSGHTAAIYWSGRAMLFAFGKPERIDKVRELNRAYQNRRPVRALD